MDSNDIIVAHQFSSNHKEELQKDKLCGCFYCLEVFDPVEIKDWILDPGFGFAKTIEQNYELLARMDEFAPLGKRMLVGVSRKSMIYKLLNITPQEALPATQVLHLKALQAGADILRVHDVAEAARTVALYRLLSSKK